jgi:hypothetical protein
MKQIDPLNPINPLTVVGPKWRSISDEKAGVHQLAGAVFPRDSKKSRKPRKAGSSLRSDKLSHS